MLLTTRGAIELSSVIVSLVVSLVVSLAGCSREQAWVFQNGVGLEDLPPARILTEVYVGAECGTPCGPPGERIYCAEIEGTARGPAPQGLADGERYCFMGTAFGASGRLESVGCAVATVGSGSITVTLSPSDEASREARCAAFDGGVGMPRATLTVFSERGGSFFVQSLSSGMGWPVASGEPFVLGSEVGQTYEITPMADPGFRFDTFEGGGCDVFIPCSTRLAGDARIDVVFVPI